MATITRKAVARANSRCMEHLGAQGMKGEGVDANCITAVLRYRQREYETILSMDEIGEAYGKALRSERERGRNNKNLKKDNGNES